MPYPHPFRHLYPPARSYQAAEALLFVSFGIAVMIMPLWLEPLMDVGFRDFVITQGARDLLLVTAIYWLLRRSGEGVAAIGWHPVGARGELSLGLWTFVPFYFGLALLELLLRRSGVPGGDGPPGYLVPDGWVDYLLATAFLVVVAVAEETIFRGYLLRRLSAVFGNPWLGAVASSLLFALGHGYQGAAGVVAVWAIGMFLCWMTLWRGSLVAPALIHFLQNFTTVVALPLAYPEAFS